MPTPLSQRPWLLRFAWGGVVLLLLLTPVVGYVGWVRIAGMSNLHRVQETTAREGRGATLHDLLADIPESDAARHERWWQWQTQVAAREARLQTFFQAWDSDDARKWQLGLSADPPVELVDAFDQMKDLATEGEALLDAGPFIAGMAGTFNSTVRADDPAWLLRAFSDILDNGYPQKPDALLHLPDTGALHFITAALEYRALSADSPLTCSQSLHRMDRLVEALSHPVGQTETMCLLLATTRRDDAYLAAILRRSLSDEEFAVWLADERSSQALLLVARAFRAERLLRSGCLEPAIHSGELHLLEWHGRRIFPRPAAWLYGPGGLALCCEVMADGERRIERGPSYAFDLEHWTKAVTKTPFANFITPNLIESGVTAAESRFIARRIRIIALLVRHAWSAEAPAGLPEVRALLGPHASWLDPSDDQCALSYTRLTTDRFRVGIDLTTSTDGLFTPLVRYRSMSKPSSYRSTRGAPPPPRTDLPAKSGGRMADVEIWIPQPASK